MKSLYYALAAVRACSIASQKTINSGKADFLSNAIRRASNGSNFLMFFETLASLMDSDCGTLYIVEPGQPEVPENEKAKTVPVLPFVAQIDASPETQRILSFLRTFSKTVSSLCFLKQKEFELAASTLSLNAVPNPPAITGFNRKFRIPMKFTTITELHHGADFKSGNTAFMRRQTVIGADGQLIQIPFVSGNSIRGIVRDLLADDFLIAIGLEPNRNKPPVALWFFHALYSGGTLSAKTTDEEGDKKSKVKKEESEQDISNLIGKGGRLRSEGIRIFRDTFPALSALGCAVKDRILAGETRPSFGDFLPDCTELGTGTVSVETKLGWEFLTRREDHEGHEESTAMIAQSEIIRPGTVFSGGVDYSSFSSPVVRSALGRGLELLKERGYVGGANSRGYGKVFFEIENAPDGDCYKDYLAQSKNEIISMMQKIGAVE